MSGIYPDGVTGNEPAIAGVPTREHMVWKKCDNEDGCKAVMLNDEEWETFEGDVEVEESINWSNTYEAGVLQTWTCPVCGTEHADDETIELQDPDRDRD